MKRTFYKFCVLQAAYWSFYAALPCYITAYMLSKGMSAATLGILLALQMGSAFAGSMFWGRYVDKHHASKRFFLIGTVSAGLLAMFLFMFAGNTVLLFGLYPLFGFMNGPIATTLDSWAIAGMHQVEAGAKSRTFGTLGYAVTMLISGQIIGRFGYRFMPFVAAALLVLAVTVALSQPEVTPESRGDGVKEKSSPRELMHLPKYLLLIGVVFFTGMAIGPINNMKVLVFESVGGDVSFLGWEAFIGCLIQSPFLIFSSKIKRIKSDYRLILGALCAFAYVALVYFAINPSMVILGTIFTNISFGLLFPTMREITEESVDGSLRTTAHSLVDVAYGSVASMIASAWSGTVIENAGRKAMCSICMGLEVIALVFCCGIILLSRKVVVRRSQRTSV